MWRGRWGGGGRTVGVLVRIIRWRVFGNELTMCGFEGSVDTRLKPRRNSVGARALWRMQRVERANVLDSIVL
jgi:hypothetical protein